MKWARVRVDGETVGEIGAGLLALVAVGKGDGAEDVAYLARKIAELRLFRSAGSHFGESVEESGGSVLLVSQFTLYGDTRRGRRPDFSGAAAPSAAAELLAALAKELRRRGLAVETGRFGADMEVELLNDGPVTIWLESGAPRQ